MLNQQLSQQLIEQLNQQSEDTTNSVNTLENTEQSKDYDFTQRLKFIIDEHYQSEFFTVEQFAKALCLSPRTLQLKIKALYDLTPSDYIRNTRLSYAKELLIVSDLSVGLIAEQVGFNSQSYFARCFKVNYGNSPKQFRDQHQKILI